MNPKGRRNDGSGLSFYKIAVKTFPVKLGRSTREDEPSPSSFAVLPNYRTSWKAPENPAIVVNPSTRNYGLLGRCAISFSRFIVIFFPDFVETHVRDSCSPPPSPSRYAGGIYDGTSKRGVSGGDSSLRFA